MKPDYIVCLEDGKKFKTLKRHLLSGQDLLLGVVDILHRLEHQVLKRLVLSGHPHSPWLAGNIV